MTGLNRNILQRAEAKLQEDGLSTADFSAIHALKHKAQTWPAEVQNVLVYDSSVVVQTANGEFSIGKSQMVQGDWYRVYSKCSSFEQDCMMARYAIGWYESRKEMGTLPAGGGRIQ